MPFDAPVRIATLLDSLLILIMQACLTIQKTCWNALSGTKGTLFVLELSALHQACDDETDDIALRFCAVMAWVYVSIVTRLGACRMSSCITLMSVRFALSNVEEVWWNMCHPLGLVIPTARAAG
jgi:hypothetical protein